MKYWSAVMCLLSIILSYGSVSAQEDSLSIKKYQVATVPQFVYRDGLRTDFEFKFGKKEQYLQLSPRVYFSSEERRFFGTGLGVAHKIYTLESAKRHFYPYLSYGIEYTHLFFTNYSNSSLSSRDVIDFFRLNANVGFQINIAQFIFLDLFVGTGLAYCIDSQVTYPGYLGLAFDMYDYEYTGIYIPLGFRFGIML